MNPDESLVRHQTLPLPPATATAICTAAPAASTPHRSATTLHKRTVLQFRFVFKLHCYFGHVSVKGYDLPYERIAKVLRAHGILHIDCVEGRKDNGCHA